MLEIRVDERHCDYAGKRYGLARIYAQCPEIVMSEVFHREHEIHREYYQQRYDKRVVQPALAFVHICLENQRGQYSINTCPTYGVLS